MTKQIKSLYDLLTESYGVKTAQRTNPLTSTVATTVTKILPLNPMRLSLLVINLGGNGVYLSIDETVSTTKGIYLSPNGGSMTLKWTDDFEFVASDFYAIASGGSSTVYAIEVYSV